MTKNFSRLKERARLLHEKKRILRNSSAYARVVGVLSGLGFLIAPEVRPSPRSKVDLLDAITIGRTFEPRILEVLPAAVLSFPGSFLHKEQAPQVFQEILSALRAGKNGPDFETASFKKILEAAKRPTKNKRRKAVGERRISKTFRFAPETLARLKGIAEQSGKNYTEVIEMLVKDCA
jgi:hypothetical protein